MIYYLFVFLSWAIWCIFHTRWLKHNSMNNDMTNWRSNIRVNVKVINSAMKFCRGDKRTWHAYDFILNKIKAKIYFISVRHLTPLNEKEGKKNMHPWLVARKVWLYWMKKINCFYLQIHRYDWCLTRPHWQESAVYHSCITLTPGTIFVTRALMRKMVK